MDSKIIRTQLRSDTWNSATRQHEYPQTPARVILSVFAEPGVDWKSEDFIDVLIQTVKVSCLRANSPPGTSKGTSYWYKDVVGNNQSVVDGDRLTVLKSNSSTGLDIPSSSTPANDTGNTGDEGSPSGLSPSNSPSSPSPTSGGHELGGGGQLSTGAKAGIGVGVGLFAIILLVLALFIWRRQRRATSTAAQAGFSDLPEPHDPTTAVTPDVTKPELETTANKHEIETATPDLVPPTAHASVPLNSIQYSHDVPPYCHSHSEMPIDHSDHNPWELAATPVPYQQPAHHEAPAPVPSSPQQESFVELAAIPVGEREPYIGSPVEIAATPVQPSLTFPVSMLAEQGARDDEIRRLEEEERRIDQAIAESERLARLREEKEAVRRRLNEVRGSGAGGSS